MELEEMLKKLKEELKKDLESKITDEKEAKEEIEEEIYIKVNKESVEVNRSEAELLTLLTCIIRSLKENIDEKNIRAAVELGLAENIEEMKKIALETVLKRLKDALNK